MDEKAFELGLGFVLQKEAGFVDDPDDEGGATNKGVTQAVYDQYRKNRGLAARSVAEIEDHEVEEIYRVQYWYDLGDGLRKVSIALFDTAVNSGRFQANNLLQRAVGAAEDGIIGIGTMQAIRSAPEIAVVERFLAVRRVFYKELVDLKPVRQKFFQGWINRVNDLEQFLAGI